MANSEIYASLKGHFLMAMPGMADPNFNQTVTCISEHTVDGALGIVVNRVFDGLSAEQVFNELKIDCNADAGNIPVHFGGPVHGNELFVLHGAPLEDDGILRIGEGLALNNSRKVLEQIAMGTGPAQYLIALGCAGWGAGQLEWEMKENAWLTLPCEYDIIFEVPVEERWESAINKLGIDPDLLSETAGNA